MAYSTPASVRKAIVPSSDGNEPTTATHTAADLSDAALSDAIAEADSTIDGYIGSRYQTPVPPDATTGKIPNPLPFWSRNLAAYFATLTFRGSQDLGDSDPISRRYKDTLSALKSVSSGHMNLNAPANTGPSSSVEAGSPVNPYVGDLWSPEDFSLDPAASPDLASPQRVFWTDFG